MKALIETLLELERTKDVHFCEHWHEGPQLVQRLKTYQFSRAQPRGNGHNSITPCQECVRSSLFIEMSVCRFSLVVEIIAQDSSWMEISSYKKLIAKNYDNRKECTFQEHMIMPARAKIITLINMTFPSPLTAVSSSSKFSDSSQRIFFYRRRLVRYDRWMHVGKQA